MAEIDSSAAEGDPRQDHPSSKVEMSVCEPSHTPAEVPTEETYSPPVADPRLAELSDEANPLATMEPDIVHETVVANVTAPNDSSDDYNKNISANEEPTGSAAALVSTGSTEGLLEERSPGSEVANAPQQPSQEQRRGLNFGLDAWKKASGTASSFLIGARESRLKSAMALGKATLTDFIQSLENGDPHESEASPSREEMPPTSSKSSMEVVQPSASSAPFSQSAAAMGLTEEENKRLEAFAHLHQQIEQLDEERERLRQVEMRLKREIDNWKKLAEDRQRMIEQFETQLETRVAETERSVRAELQQEFVKAMTDNERRISDLKIAIKQREKLLEEVEVECERRANALEESLERQNRLTSDLESQRQLEQRLHEEIESVTRNYQVDLDRWKAKHQEVLTDLEVARTINQEVGEKRQQGDHVTAALEAENRQLQAQLSAMKNRWSALSIFEGSLDKASQELLTESERAALEECKTPNDVLTLFKKSQLLLTQLERRLSVSTQTVDSLQSEISQLRQANDAYQAEIASMKERMISNMSRGGMVENGPSHTRPAAVEVDTSVVAMLEARLAAKTERVEALVCEVAQLRSQLSSSQQSEQKKGMSPTFANDGFAFFDDGRDSLFWILILVPILRLVGKLKGANTSHRLENKFRKINNKLTRHPTVLFIDQKLRFIASIITRSRTTRFASLLYFVAIHLVLFLSLLVSDTGSHRVAMNS